MRTRDCNRSVQNLVNNSIRCKYQGFVCVYVPEGSLLDESDVFEVLEERKRGFGNHVQHTHSGLRGQSRGQGQEPEPGAEAKESGGRHFGRRDPRNLSHTP